MLTKMLFRKCFFLTPNILKITLLPKYFFSNKLQFRTFLSQAYNCKQSWDKRLKTNLLNNVNIEDFALKIQSNLEKETRVAPVDIDILANKLEIIDPDQLDYMINLFYKFRHTSAAVSVLESTSHAFIRALMKFNKHEKLLTILDDKINYGIFLDDFLASLLLDYFIVSEDYKNGVRIAYELMLQENFKHPISQSLSLYVCDKFLRNNISEILSFNEIKSTDIEDEEEEWVRVKWIVRPWFDGHFDIKKQKWLLGKTFIALGREIDNCIGRSYQLIGLGLLEKFSEAFDILKQENLKTLVSIDALNIFHQTLESCPVKEILHEKSIGLLRLEDVMPYITVEEKNMYLKDYENVLIYLKSKEKLSNLNLELEVKNVLEESIRKTESFDILTQEKMHAKFNELRENAFKDEIQELELITEKKNIASRLIALQEKEEKLSYFEQLEKVKLGILRSPKIKPIVEIKEEEEFVAPPGERGRKKQ